MRLDACQLYPETGTLARYARQCYARVMLLRDPCGKAQAETRAGDVPADIAVHSVEAIEDTFVVFFRDTDAGIFYRQVNLTFLH